jgi:hypothetical protein
MTEKISIDKSLKIGNIVTADIEIKKSAKLISIGIVNGNITIQNGGFAEIHGIVNGNIINSGQCKIFGTINGILTDNGGKYEIDKNALIQKIK